MISKGIKITVLICIDTYSLSRESFGKPRLGSPSLVTPVTCTPSVVLGAAKDRDRALLLWQRNGSLGCICFFFLATKSDQVQNFPLGNKGQSQIKICFWNCEVWTDLFAPAPAAQGISYPPPSPLRMPCTDTTPGTALQRIFLHGVHPSAGTLPTSSGPHFDTMQKKPSGCLKPISKIHCSRDKRCVFKRPILRDTKRYLWDSS